VTPRGRILPTSERLFSFALHLCVRAGEPVARGDLIEMFWPASDEMRGRHSLRQMLYRLRELGFAPDEDGELLSLDPRRVRCDLTEALRAEWIAEADAETISAVCDALPELMPRISEAYGEWIDGVRARLESQFRRAALRVLAEVKTEGRWYDVEHWALMLLRSDPLNETAVLARAEGTAMLGSKAEAIEQLDRYLDELGPRAERIGLPAKVLRRRIKEQGERKTGHQALPLVGREEEMRVLTEGLYGEDSVQPQCYFLCGPPGIGKSRMLTECASIGELSGLAVILISLSTRDASVPNSLLATLAHRLLEQKGSLGSDPRALAILRRLALPPIGQSESPVPGSAAISANDLAWSIDNVLGAVLQETRLLVAVDNADFASSADASTLLRMFFIHSQHRFFLYFAGRECHHFATQSPFQPPSASITTVRLRPLTHDKAATLARLAYPESDTKPTTERVALTVSMAAGNPLFLLELSRSEAFRHPHNALPRSLQKAISARLSSLAPELRDLCGLLSILDNDATIRNIEALSSCSGVELTARLASLEMEGIVHVSSGGSLHLHDCWHSAITDALSPLTRILLATHAAEHITQQTSQSPTPESLATVARLFVTAENHTQACHAYIGAARLSYEKGLCEQAIRLIAAADEYCTDVLDSLSLLRIKACAEHALEDYTSAIASARQGLLLGTQDDAASAGHRTILTGILADASWKNGTFTQETIDRLVLMVSHPELDPLARELSCFLGLRLAYNVGSGATADAFFKVGTAHLGLSDSSAFSALIHLVYMAENGTCDDVTKACQALSSSHFSSLPLQYSALCYRYIAQAQRWAGDYQSARRIGSFAFEEASRKGLLNEASMIALQQAFTELDLAIADRASTWLALAESNALAPRSHERHMSLRHAQVRLLLLESRWTSVLTLLASEEDSIYRDPILRRRISDAGALALAASFCSSHDIVERAFSTSVGIINADTPCLQTDFPVTAFVRALRNCDREQEANEFLVRYCHRRAAVYKRPVAPYYREIAEYIGTSIS